MAEETSLKNVVILYPEARRIYARGDQKCMTAAFSMIGSAVSENWYYEHILKAYRDASGKAPPDKPMWCELIKTSDEELRERGEKVEWRMSFGRSE
ncbi:hypothetical protein HJFPF1_02669 [Paramyrothecium foliicola]|nr:hypothetical protein HJFPF1_02669 [Paramyrothecium foliicola]